MHPNHRPLAVLGLAVATAMSAASIAGAAPVAGDGPSTSVHTGTDGDDTLVGNHRDETFRALGGADRIYGRRGRDTIYAGKGADRVHGGRGNDRIRGGNGPDRLFGEKGADRIRGGDGNDVIFVGAGRDIAYGGDGDDVIYAKSRRDIDGRHDRDGDRVYGGKGNDVINTRDGERDLVACGDGRDRAVLDHKDRILGGCERVQRRSARTPSSAPKRTRLAAVRWALGQLGVVEQPLGSNRGPKIDAWSQRVGMLGVPWCGIFVHESFLRAGRDLHNATASTDFIRGSAEAETNGFRAIPLREARRGDLVLLDFPGGDGDDHVALVTRRLRNGYVHTVDGNRSHRVKRSHYSASTEVAMAVRVTRR